MKRNLRGINRVCLYAASVVLALLLSSALGPAFVSAYWAAAFWSLVALDFYRSHCEDFATDAASPLADRIVAYIFVAPFIFPARALELAPARAQRSC